MPSSSSFLTSELPRDYDFSIYIANVAFHAAPVFCQWWASQFDSNMKEDVKIDLLDLHRKIDFTQPKPLGQMLRLLKTLMATYRHYSDISKDIHFFDLVINPHRRRFIDKSDDLLFILKKEMQSLTTSILPSIPDDDAEDEQSFFLDFSLLISEKKESSNCSLLGNGNLLLTLLTKVSLMEIEVFIVEQLIAGDDFLLSKEGKIDAMVVWVLWLVGA